MKRRLGALRCTPLCLSAIALIGCSDSTEPRTGSIKATVITTSAVEDRDVDGYLVSVDAGAQFLIGVSAALTIGDLDAGIHTVSLEGLAPNCTVTSPNPVNVDIVTSGDPSVTTPVTFSVACVPRIGSIRVLITTSGEDPDADGYSLNVAGRFHTDIPVNGTRIFSGVRDGGNAVTLAGVAGNCTVNGGTTKTVAVAFGGTSDVQFTVHCVAAGSVRVTTATTGFFTVSGTHALELRQSGTTPFARIHAPANGTMSFAAIPAGTFRLVVLDLVPNCDQRIPGTQEIVVPAGPPTDVKIEIDCPTEGRIALDSEVDGNHEVFVVTPGGSGQTRLTFDVRPDANPAWSPDGTRIAFASERDGNREIYVMNGDGTDQVRLTTHSARDDFPAWSPDGKRIAFSSNRDESVDIYVMNADGSNQVRLTTAAGIDDEPTWSPDGSMIAFSSTRQGVSSIWVMKSDGSNPVRIGGGVHPESQPAWSPDGTRIAFSVQTSTKASTIVLIRPDGSESEALPLAFTENSNPAWSPDGRKILYATRECYYNDFYYGNSCWSTLSFIGVSGVPYSYSLYVTGRVTRAAWRP
jgi:Tol biopolymer transport system component